MYKVRIVLIYFLILTLISSVLTYRIVVKAYENAYGSYLPEWTALI